ncbi:carbonic anhydrase 4b [Betta splendens]|uniref:Carbonic anhydrase n=1 Tax=Betta splendens TaxID=158456 RepID=A0A6P7P4G7_BETSP|nr:carbonic anhydrase 4b [Betta splendens]
MLLKAVLILYASFMEIASGAEWCYQSQITCNHTCTGPDTWGHISSQCSGQSQSPINIVTRKMLPDGRLTPFQFIGYQDTFHSILINNGHTVELDLPSSIKIKGGNLAATYKAVQLHLHWGKEGRLGSEHTIDGERFPMEMHIVHIKQEYNSLTQAVTDSTGVAVLGFFFKESPSANKKYDPLINALMNIKQPSTNTTVTGVSLDMFVLPQENMSKYLRYDGSLTTPNCNEAVVWTLFEDTVHLSREQLAAFFQLKFSNGEKMVETYRPVQPVNGRQVYYSNAHVAVVSTVLLMVSTLLSSAFTLDTTG